MSIEQDYSEEQIKKMFQSAAFGRNPSADTLAHIHSKGSSDASGKDGGITMFKRNYVKVAAVALVCILLSGGAVYASRGLTWYGSGRPGEYTDYSKLDKAFEKAGLDASAPEELAYGFKFKEASIDTFGQMADGNKKISEYKGVDVIYEDDAGQQITLVIEPVVTDDTDEKPISEKTISDSTIAYYDRHEMLFVPSEDDISEDDRHRELTDPKFWISVGSDETEMQVFSNVRFEIDGIFYDVTGFDLDLDQDEMFEIAGKVADWNL